MMSCNPPFNRLVVEELEEENTLLRALLSCATGVWHSTEDDESTEDAMIITSAKAESMEGG